MKAIASALIDILQTKSENIISQVQQQSAQQFICVKRTIIDWSRLQAAEPGTRNLLKTATDQSQENSEWFKHIEICPRPETPGLLFSVRVNTQISEHNLIAKDHHQAIASQRKLADRLLQIVWVPRLWNKVEDGKWEYQLSPKTENAKKWVLPEALVIEYDVKSLTRRPSHKDPEEYNQYHAAGAAALSRLFYCCLWLIIDGIKQNGNSKFTALMLRTSDQNSALIPKEFLQDVFQKFPDLCIYTMMRDVFPGTRLIRRNYNEAAFEILQAEDHTDFWRSSELSSFADSCFPNFASEEVMRSPFLEQASLWGQVFEIAVKRGVLHYLIHCKLLDEQDSSQYEILKPWREVKNIDIYRHLVKALDLTDTNALTWVDTMLRHLLVLRS